MSLLITLCIQLVFPRSSDQIDNQVESLISDALSSIDQGEFELARLYLEQAAIINMSEDSLHYFMAKTYMYEENIEEALLLNSAMNPQPKSSIRKMQLEQRYAIYIQLNDSIAAAQTYDSLVIAYTDTKRDVFFPGISITSTVGFDFLRERQAHDFSVKQIPSYEVNKIGPDNSSNIALNVSWKIESIAQSTIKFGLKFKVGKSFGSNSSPKTSQSLQTFYNNLSKSTQPFVQWNNIFGIWSVSGAYSHLKLTSGGLSQTAIVNNSINFSAGSWFCLMDLGVSTNIKPLLHGSIDFFTQFDQTYMSEHGFILSLYSSYINGEAFNAAFSEPSSIFYNEDWSDDYSISIQSGGDTCTVFTGSESCDSITKKLFFNVHPQQFISIAPKLSYRFSPFSWLSIETAIGYQYDFSLKLSRWLYLNIPSDVLADAAYSDERNELTVDVLYDNSSGNYFIRNPETGTMTGILNEMQVRRVDHLPSAELILEFNTNRLGMFELAFGYEKTFSNMEQYLPLDINDYTVDAYIRWYFSFKALPWNL